MLHFTQCLHSNEELSSSSSYALAAIRNKFFEIVNARAEYKTIYFFFPNYFFGIFICKPSSVVKIR